VPLWFVRTVRSFLSKWSTTIVVDGVETALQLLAAKVLQGSLLSLMLFLFYNALLLKALDLLELRLSTLGFADDINLLTYSESTVVNCITLELAHDRCLAWASMLQSHTIERPEDAMKARGLIGRNLG
jgi:hypothetical protein